MRIEHTRPAAWPAVAPGRFASSIRVESPAGCNVALLGLPDDTGVRLNGGRPGAAQGPGAFRTALSSFGTTWDGLHKRELQVQVFDAGDVEPAAGDDPPALFETHRRVEAAARALHELNLTVVCVGGGHDLSLPSITALAKHSGQSVAGVNLDAHLDVRERVGSGMPFRRLITGGFLDPHRFVELGLGRFANDRADYEWLAEQGASLVLASALQSNSQQLREAVQGLAGAPSFVSIDLDGIDAAHAPGVSAANPCGLSAAHAAELSEAAGALPSVRHFDLMELCPPHDLGARTAKLTAYLFLCFLAGFATRQP